MAERTAQGVQRAQILLCVLPRREPHSVVPLRTPGSDWSAGSQHQTRADLSMRVPFTTTIPAAACFSSPGGAPQGHDDWWKMRLDDDGGRIVLDVNAVDGDGLLDRHAEV